MATDRKKEGGYFDEKGTYHPPDLSYWYNFTPKQTTTSSWWKGGDTTAVDAYLSKTFERRLHQKSNPQTAKKSLHSKAALSTPQPSKTSQAGSASSSSDDLSPGLRKAQLTDKDYERILTAGAEVIAAEARSIVERTAKRRTGRLQSSITYRLSPALASPKATMGWEEQPLGSTSTYVDGQGRSRKVETVADYARILEYSDRRQLRHMEAARDLCEAAALDAMEREADAAMGRLADAFEQDTF